MRIGAFLFAAALLWPAVVPAQDLSGSYRYQGPDGAAVLTLRQESPVRLTGTLEMTNGASFGIEGQVENGRATGDVIFDGGRGFFAAGFQGSTLLVVIAERNPANGQPMLDAGWSLQFARVQGGSGEPAAAGASVPAPYAGVVPAPAARPAPAPSPASAAVMPQQGSPGAGAGTSAANGGFAQTDQSPAAQAWIQKLRGKKVTYISSYSSNSNDSFGGYSDKWEAFLCSDGRFVYRSRSLVTADVGDVSGSSSGRGSMTGVWRIITQGNQAAIEYRSDQGESSHVMLGFQDGKTYWDGQRVLVTDQNDVCR